MICVDQKKVILLSPHCAIELVPFQSPIIGYWRLLTSGKEQCHDLIFLLFFLAVFQGVICCNFSIATA